jgi:hypothetical protein
MSKTLSKDMERSRDSRTVIADEKGNLATKGDLTRWQRTRIFLNRWWVFALLVLAACQVVQTIVVVLKYLRRA